LAFVERVSSALPIDRSSGGGSTIARSAMTHLAGTGRVNLVKSPPACTVSPKWRQRLSTLSTRTTTTLTMEGQSGAEEGQGAVGPAICTAGVPAAEMACRMDLGMSILEGSSVLAN
jgi:hypothetical protein